MSADPSENEAREAMKWACEEVWRSRTEDGGRRAELLYLADDHGNRYIFTATLTQRKGE